MVYIVFGVFIAFLLLMGYWFYRREETTVGYYIANRRIGPLVVLLSYFATLSSTGVFIGGGGFGFKLGMTLVWMAVFDTLFTGVGFLFFAPRIRTMTENLGSITIADFMEFRFGSKYARLIAAIIALFVTSLYIVPIYKGFGHVMEVMFGIPYAWGVLIIGIPVALYVTFGGMRAVLWTDVVQGILMLIGAFLLFFFVTKAVGGFSTGVQKLTEMNPKLVTTPGLAPLVLSLGICSHQSCFFYR